MIAGTCDTRDAAASPCDQSCACCGEPDDLHAAGCLLDPAALEDAAARVLALRTAGDLGAVPIAS